VSGSDTLLITGASGFLGQNVRMQAGNRFNVVGTYNETPIRIPNGRVIKLDLTQPTSIDRVIRVDPDLIVHCAAETDVDYCEIHPEAAFRTNVVATSHVAEAARETDAMLVQISTDAVFKGERGNYSERDKPDPVNIYGETKLEAEGRALSTHRRTAVVRTNIFGWSASGDSTLAEWMLKKLRSGSELPAIEDARFSPILANELANIAFELYDIDYSGHIHVAANDALSKLEFARLLADEYGFEKKLIKPIELSELDFTASRGKDLSLNVERAESVLDRPLPTVDQGISTFVKLEEEGYRQTLSQS
jgi:dTDP-4-dehydrorhamnose reductase